MSDPRLLFVSPYDLSLPGGVQGQVRAMALEMQRRGRTVAVGAPGSDVDAELRDAGIEVIAGGHVTRFPSNGSVAPVTLSLRAARRLASWAEENGPVVAHLHEPVTPVMGWSLLRRHRGGLVATFHRSGVDPLYRLTGPVLARLIRRVDASAAVSEAAAHTAKATLGISPEVLFNGIDVEAAQRSDPWPTRGPTVLFLGRDEPRKGRQVLLDAAARLPEDVTIWLTGSPPEGLSGSGARLEWLGVIGEEEKRRRLCAADVLCAPSLGGESFGMVLLEALAASTAVVASDIDGYRQALGGHGQLVEPGDPAQLAEALVRQLERAPTESRAEGLVYARRWSMAALMDRYEALYEHASSSGRSRWRG